MGTEGVTTGSPTSAANRNDLGLNFELGVLSRGVQSVFEVFDAKRVEMP